jgi:hypothetical protein
MPYSNPSRPKRIGWRRARLLPPSPNTAAPPLHYGGIIADDPRFGAPVRILRWNRCYAQRKQNRITGIASYQRRRPRQGQPRCRANQRQGCTPARNYCRHRGARGKITAPHDSRGRAEHQEPNPRAR